MATRTSRKPAVFSRLMSLADAVETYSAESTTVNFPWQR